MAEHPEALQSTLDSLDKRWGEGTVMRLSDPGMKVSVRPSGVRAVDRLVGIGGYPKGRIVEVFGPEAVGKTTLALPAIASVQAAGGVAAFVDADHTLDVTYARNLGVSTDELLVTQPDNGEQALEIVEALVRSGAVDIVVIDSVANLVPRHEIEGEFGDAHEGLQARLMSQALRKITAVTSRTNAIVMFINQVREKRGVTFGNGETTTGGNALKFYASLRIDIRRIGALSPTGSPTSAPVKQDDLCAKPRGAQTRIKTIKNKLAPPFQVVEVPLVYGRGFCPYEGLIAEAHACGVLAFGSGRYHLGEETLGSHAYLVERLGDEPELERALIDAIEKYGVRT